MGLANVLNEYLNKEFACSFNTSMIQSIVCWLQSGVYEFMASSLTNLQQPGLHTSCEGLLENTFVTTVNIKFHKRISD